VLTTFRVPTVFNAQRLQMVQTDTTNYPISKMMPITRLCI